MEIASYQNMNRQVFFYFKTSFFTEPARKITSRNFDVNLFLTLYNETFDRNQSEFQKNFDSFLSETKGTGALIFLSHMPFLERPSLCHWLNSSQEFSCLPIELAFVDVFQHPSRQEYTHTPGSCGSCSIGVLVVFFCFSFDPFLNLILLR